MSIIPDKIEEIRLDCNPITKEELSDDKVGILDIKAKLNNNVNCNIEMQIVDKNNIEKRILFYWSKMYIGGIKKGEDYSVLERTIVILITDYNLKQLKEIPEYMTKWNLRSDKYPKKILTDAIEIYIIEANKAKEFSFKNNKTLDSWLKFINNPKEESQMENEEIKKAKKVLEEISQDRKEREMSELREKYIMDQKAVYKQGYEYGKEAGIKEIAKKRNVCVLISLHNLNLAYDLGDKFIFIKDGNIISEGKKDTFTEENIFKTFNKKCSIVSYEGNTYVKFIKE